MINPYYGREKVETQSLTMINLIQSRVGKEKDYL